MNETQTLLSDTVTRLFTDRVTTGPPRVGREGAVAGQALAGGGGERPHAHADPGGAGRRRGARGRTPYIVVAAAGRFGVPLPIAETMVGAWFLAESGLDVPFGPITVAPVHADERLTLERDGAGWRLGGTATRVPWGRGAEHVVVVAGDMVALVPAGRRHRDARTSTLPSSRGTR